MKPKFRSPIAAFAPLRRSSLIVCATLCAAAAAHADQSWSGATDALWTTPGNWSGAATPGLSDVAVFDANSTANLATTLGADFSVKGIKVVDPAGAVSVAAGNVLTIGASGVDMSAATQNLTLSNATINGTGLWSIAAGRTLQMEGSIAGTGGITKNGSGQLFVHWFPHAFSGGLTVNAGEVRTDWGGPSNGGSNTTASLGAGPLTLNGGSIRFQSTKAATVDSDLIIEASGGTFSYRANGYFNPASIAGSGTMTFSMDNGITVTPSTFLDFDGTIAVTPHGAGGNFRLASGYALTSGQYAAWNLGAGAHVSRQNGTSFVQSISIGSLTGVATADIGGSAAGSGTFVYQIGGRGEDCAYDGGIVDGGTKTGLEVVNGITLTLTNTSALTYTGATTITDGFLKINGVKSAGATDVTDYGVLTGTGSVGGTTNVAAFGSLAPGDDLVAGGIGNISVSNLSLAAGSVLNLQFDSGNDTVTIPSGGTLTLANGATVDVNGFGVDGAYTIINTAGATVSGSAATALTVVNGDPSKVYSFVDTGSAIQMTISSEDPTNFWNVDGGGTWESAGNWTKNEIPDASGAVARIGPGVGGGDGFFSDFAFTITLDADQTVGALAIDDDFDTEVTIDPGTTTPGSLIFDNGVVAANLTSIAGNHTINAPMVVDAEGVAVDVADSFTLDLNGQVSGSGAALSKSGPGTLILAGDNTYSGGTTLSAGVVSINSATSLGDTAGAVIFGGGALQLAAPLAGVTRSYQVTGSSDARIDTNGNDFGYAGVISPANGGTGGLNKLGAGTLTLTADQTYTGITTVSGGILNLAAGSSINGGAANIAQDGGGQLVVSGGTLTANAASSIGGGSAGLLVSDGSATFNSGVNATNNNFSGFLVAVTGGSFNTSFLTMGRGGLNFSAEPGAGATTSGFYANGGTSTIAGDFNIGYNSNQVNSSVSARIDSGSVTVDGTTLIGLNNGGRWSVLDVNGGIFTSTNVANGVIVGTTFAGNGLFLVRSGTATVERILLRQIAASTSTSRVRLNGGALYVGSGGIVGDNGGGVGVLDIQLGTAILGAKASWSSALPMTLNADATIKTADALDAAFDITLSGALGGTGNLVKTGAGTLTLSGTNTYAGTTTVSTGSLLVTGDNGGATGDVTVESDATLGGNGNLGGNVTIQSGGHHALAVADAPGNQTTRVISGTLTLDSGHILDLAAAAAPEAGTYVLATATGGITGTLENGTINLDGFTGTVAINGNNLELTVTGGGSAYDAWASANSLTAGVNVGPNDDPDNDGVSNILEFVLGGNPLGADPSILPDPAISSTDFVFTFSRTDESETEVALTFQHGDMVSWTDVAIGSGNASSGPEVNIVEDGANPDTITVTIPKGANTKLFGRLQAVK